MYRIHQIKLGLDEPKDKIPEKIIKKIGIRGLFIKEWHIVKESIDARDKSNIKWIYSIDFDTDKRLKLEEAPREEYLLPHVSQGALEAARNNERPVVIGFGPAGIFASLILAQSGLRPIVIERGRDVDSRAADVDNFWKGGRLLTESNVQFGEGGAGAFSDGKLTTGIKDTRIKKVLAELVQFGAPEDILYKQRPHVGTDILRIVVKNIRQEIIRLGGDIRFETKASAIVTEDGRMAGLMCRSTANEVSAGEQAVCDQNEYFLPCRRAILALGHSARDTFAMLKEKAVAMEQKPFSIGVRIEHPQKMIDKAQYGRADMARLLGAADYKLSHKCKNGRGVYTFCMCPGGFVIDASSEVHTAVTNGMSNSDRKGEYANSGLLVDVRIEDFMSVHPLAGVEFQRRYERMAWENGKGRLPRTSYGDFLSDRDDKVRRSIPEFASQAIIEAMPFLGKKVAGFDRGDAVMTAVETRSSSPVRILRDREGQASVRGIYPAGEGPGYAGGIVSAAVDGIKAAEKILHVIFR